MRTPRLPVIDRPDAPADLNELIRFAERWNLVSAHVPSHFKRSLTLYAWCSTFLQSWPYNSQWTCSVSIIKIVSLLIAHGCHGSQAVRTPNSVPLEPWKPGCVSVISSRVLYVEDCLAVEGWEWEEAGDNCVLRRFIIFWAFT
jgi:hypothetical protein